MENSVLGCRRRSRRRAWSHVPGSQYGQSVPDSVVGSPRQHPDVLPVLCARYLFICLQPAGCHMMAVKVKWKSAILVLTFLFIGARGHGRFVKRQCGHIPPKDHEVCLISIAPISNLKTERCLTSLSQTPGYWSNFYPHHNNFIFSTVFSFTLLFALSFDILSALIYLSLLSCRAIDWTQQAQLEMELEGIQENWTINSKEFFSAKFFGMYWEGPFTLLTSRVNMIVISIENIRIAKLKSANDFGWGFKNSVNNCVASWESCLYVENFMRRFFFSPHDWITVRTRSYFLRTVF